MTSDKLDALARSLRNAADLAETLAKVRVMFGDHATVAERTAILSLAAAIDEVKAMLPANTAAL